MRFLFPNINFQDTELSLFKKGAFGNSVGWKTNGRGVSFGKIVTIDSDGFRKMDSPSQYNESWVILGDSVAFGVGVDTNKTFAQMLQDRYDKVKLWNTSVVGYSVYNHRDVVDVFLTNRNDVKKVFLFFCLNDIYGNLHLTPVYDLKEKVFSFFRRNSKFYILAKNILFDRGKAYAEYDIGLYKKESPQF